MEFYEEDEPIDEVLAAFAEGEDGVTARPRSAQPCTYSTPATSVHYQSFIHVITPRRPLASQEGAANSGTAPANA